MNNQLSDRTLPEIGEVWRHYKGDLYRIICIAQQEADEIPVVVYQSVRTSIFFTRPLKEFVEVLGEDATWFYRFEKVGNSAPTATDLTLFLDLYKRFGVEVEPEFLIDRFLIFLPCGSIVEFDENDRFFSQHLAG